MTELLVIGETSAIGAAIIAHCARNGIATISTSRQPGAMHHFDLSQDTKFSIPGNPEAAILCIGAGSMQYHENHPKETYRANVTNAGHLLDKLQAAGIPCIVLSTSQVFGANPASPPREDTKPSPECEYARQKVALEEKVIQGGVHAVVRLAKVIHSGLPILQKWRVEGKANAFSNLFISPIGIEYTAHSLLSIAKAPQPGIAHLSAATAISYLELAELVGVQASGALAEQGNTRETTALDMSNTTRLYGIAPAQVAAQVAPLHHSILN